MDSMMAGVRICIKQKVKGIKMGKKGRDIAICQADAWATGGCKKKKGKKKEGRGGRGGRVVGKLAPPGE